MTKLKMYTFEIKTVKNLQDKDSPYTLIKYEFTAENFEEAEKFKKNLKEHYEKNKPLSGALPPRQASKLIEND